MTQDVTPTERALTAEERERIELDFVMRLTGPDAPSMGRSMELPRIRTTEAIRIFRETLAAATLDAERAARAEPGLRTQERCGCNCVCHAEEGKPEWPGSCVACCEPGMNCDCGRALVRAEPGLPSDNNRIEAALQQAAARVSAALFALVPGEVFDAAQRAVMDDPAVAEPLRRRQ